MDAAVIELLALVAGVSGATAAVVWPSRDRLLRRELRATVIVNLKSGLAFRGVLCEADGRSLVLRNAVAHRPGDDSPTSADGKVMVPRADVEFLQCP